MTKPLNRAERRKVINTVLKVRDESKAKKQYGLGLVVTNLMCAITFWKWTVVLWDKRLEK